MSTNPFEPSQNPFPPQPPYGNYGYYPPPQQPNNMAVGALVCGILGILMALCCWPIGFPLNIAAIALGAMSMRPPGKGLALAGVICGVLGLILTIIFAALAVMLNAWQIQNNGQNPFGQ